MQVGVNLRQSCIPLVCITKSNMIYPTYFPGVLLGSARFANAGEGKKKTIEHHCLNRTL